MKDRCCVSLGFRLERLRRVFSEPIGALIISIEQSHRFCILLLHEVNGGMERDGCFYMGQCIKVHGPDGKIISFGIEYLSPLNIIQRRYRVEWYNEIASEYRTIHLG
jgi:hypothetical protein